MRRWVVAVTALGAASVAGGQERGTAGDRLLTAFDACRKLAAADERLACFDRTTAALARAVATKEVRIVDRADVDRARRSLFGFALPNVELLDGQRDAPAFVEINSTVLSAGGTGNGRVEIVLADEGNAVWRTTDPMNFPPRPGARVRIRKGTLGNYFLSVDGRSYRAGRVR